MVDDFIGHNGQHVDEYEQYSTYISAGKKGRNLKEPFPEEKENEEAGVTPNWPDRDEKGHNCSNSEHRGHSNELRVVVLNILDFVEVW